MRTTLAIGFNGWCNLETNYTTNSQPGFLDFLDAHYIVEFASMQVVGGSENITNSYKCISVSSWHKIP